jgi:hypothetical protein
MTNNKQETAVDSIIEFCQKQMDNDSSIHKGVYLSIIKFCKEQITEESEVHWKTTLITSKPMEMTNETKQTGVEWFLDQLIEHRIIIVDKTTYQVKYKHQILLQKAKEMDKERLTDAYCDGKANGMDISHPLSLTKEISANEWYEQTYGGNK